MHFVEEHRVAVIPILGIEGLGVLEKGRIQPRQDHTADFEFEGANTHQEAKHFLQERLNSGLWFEVVSADRIAAGSAKPRGHLVGWPSRTHTTMIRPGLDSFERRRRELDDLVAVADQEERRQTLAGRGFVAFFLSQDHQRRRPGVGNRQRGWKTLTDAR